MEALFYVENLPHNTTEADVIASFDLLGEIKTIAVFRFQTELTVYDFQSAIIQFELTGGNVDSGRIIEAIINDMVINGRPIRGMAIGNLDVFVSSAIFFEVEPRRFESAILQADCFDISQILTNYRRPLFSYVVRFKDVHSCQKFLSEWTSSRACPLMSPDHICAFPSSFETVTCIPEKLENMKRLYDFELIHMGRRYRVYRATAASLSKRIEKCEVDYLRVPAFPGPFEMIADFLNLLEITITPETEKFVFVMASFLGIQELIDVVDVSLDDLLTVDTAAATTLACPFAETKECENLCKFIAGHLDDIVALDSVACLSADYAARIMEIAKGGESHDIMLQLLMMLPVENVPELLKMVDRGKVSPAMLSEFEDFASRKGLDIKSFVA